LTWFYLILPHFSVFYQYLLSYSLLMLSHSNNLISSYLEVFYSLYSYYWLPSFGISCVFTRKVRNHLEIGLRIHILWIFTSIGFHRVVSSAQCGHSLANSSCAWWYFRAFWELSALSRKAFTKLNCFSCLYLLVLFRQLLPKKLNFFSFCPKQDPLTLKISQFSCIFQLLELMCASTFHQNYDLL